MEKELNNFIKENSLSPFNKTKTLIKSDKISIYKTRDAKSVETKVKAKLANGFEFVDTSCLFSFFSNTINPRIIIERQDYFKSKFGTNKIYDNTSFKYLKIPRAVWGPRYGIVAVTDNDETYNKLKKHDVPIKYLINEDDVLELQNYDIVQVVDVETFGLALEQLPQSVFINSVDDCYLERYLELLSGWIENFKVLEKIDYNEIKVIINELKPLMNLIEISSGKEKVTREIIEEKLEFVNCEISEKVKEMNITGESLFKMLSESKFPKELEDIIENQLKQLSIPTHFFEVSIPVKINELELEEFLRLQDASENTDFANKLKKYADELKKVPLKLQRLNEILLLYDFMSGLSKLVNNETKWPRFSDDININNAKNIFLDNPQEIIFNLDCNYKCSILTGANSGGKTTLIEHILQIITLFNIGLPIIGEIELPLFSEVYYFGKNKGSASKGAFETLLTQMSKIKPGDKTLILADEIEAVTEPGVAGKIISATAEYFIKKKCFLVIATHLGHEIKEIMPPNSRIDGIEAKGLDEKNELIVNHNPVLGRIANSTPELIVEKMAKASNQEYFQNIHEFMKNNQK